MTIARDLRQLADQPKPFFGGLLGTLLSCTVLVGVALWGPSPAAAEPEPTFTVEFVPASLLSTSDADTDAQEVAGEPAQPPTEPISEQPVDSVSETASTPTRPDPEPREPKPQEHDPSKDPSQDPSKDPGPPADTKNPLIQDGVWSGLLADGDPWAAAVMRALRSMQIPAWAGQISSDSPYAFSLRICKDGRIDRVLRKQSTGDANLDATLEHEITRLHLPPVPAAMAAAMPRECVVLKYQFTWTATGVG